MSSIIDKLNYLNETKSYIKTAIETKGMVVPENAPFREYADLIGSITENYIISTPQVFTLVPDSWNGSYYTFSVIGYKANPKGLLVGFPPKGSVPNARAMIESALTIPRYSVTSPSFSDNTVGSISITVSAVNVPEREMKIAIYGLEEAERVTITQLAIIGLTPPVTGESRVYSIDNEQFTGSISWNPTGATEPETVYVATVTLTPKVGYKIEGIAENSFAVEGAESVTNEADSNIVIVTFPATGPAPEEEVAE